MARHAEKNLSTGTGKASALLPRSKPHVKAAMRRSRPPSTIEARCCVHASVQDCQACTLLAAKLHIVKALKACRPTRRHSPDRHTRRSPVPDARGSRRRSRPAPRRRPSRSPPRRRSPSPPRKRDNRRLPPAPRSRPSLSPLRRRSPSPPRRRSPSPAHKRDGRRRSRSPTSSPRFSKSESPRTKASGRGADGSRGSRRAASPQRERQSSASVERECAAAAAKAEAERLGCFSCLHRQVLYAGGMGIKSHCRPGVECWQHHDCVLFCVQAQGGGGGAAQGAGGTPHRGGSRAPGALCVVCVLFFPEFSGSLHATNA